MASDPTLFSLHLLQSIGVALLMVISALMAFALPPQIHYQGPLFVSWVIAELLSLAVFVALFVESILAFGYKLGHQGLLNFQMAKMITWAMTSLSGIIGMTTQKDPDLWLAFIGGWFAALVIMLLAFLLGLIYVSRNRIAEYQQILSSGASEGNEGEQQSLLQESG